MKIGSVEVDLHKPSKFENYFFTLCDVNAAMSKDPSSQVGSVIVRPNRTVFSMGWNSFPIGCDDSVEVYENRNRKLMRVVHAEANALTTPELQPKDFSLYVTPYFPCSTCAGLTIQSGITEVNVGILSDQEFPDRWLDSFNEAYSMFTESFVRVKFWKWKTQEERNMAMASYRIIP